MCILGDPGAASRDDGIFMGESLQIERESPWALTLTERVPEAFEIPPSDWPEKCFSGQSAKRNSRATLMSSYTRLFSSSNPVVAWPVQRERAVFTTVFTTVFKFKIGFSGINKHLLLPWQQLSYDLNNGHFRTSPVDIYLHANLRWGVKIFHFPLCLILTENCS